MNNQQTRRGNTQEVVYKNCHSKSGHYHWPRPVMFLYGVLESHHVLLSKVRSRIKYGMTPLFDNDRYVEDPRLDPALRPCGTGSSGMTSNLMSGSHLTYKDALNKVYRLGGSPTGAASKLWDTCHKAGNLSGLHPTYKGQRGFTLIELLVVVLIIGILAAVALPQYQKAVIKSRAVQALLFMRDAGQAMDRWVLENGTPSLGGQYFTGTSANLQWDVDLTGGMTCGEHDCSDGTFTYRASWEGFYWNVTVMYKYSYVPDGEKTGSWAYVERDTNGLVKFCESNDDEGARFCAALCSLDSGFC